MTTCVADVAGLPKKHLVWVELPAIGWDLAMDTLSTIDELCIKHGLTTQQLAERAGLDEGRVRAIVAGRWTPSPRERDLVAAVFALTRDQIAWGHKTSVDHMYGHGPQFGRSP
jgi:hypothetical protein